MPTADLVALAEQLDAAIAAARGALDDYDHRQPGSVHDGVVDTLVHLRAMRLLLGIADTSQGGAIAD